MIYTYTQGEEVLFPNYYPLPAKLFLHSGNTLTTGNLATILETVNQALANKNADLMGVIVAGWADAGIHPETCWLGYAAGASAGWNNRNVTSVQLTERFFNAFYRSGTIQIENIYRMLDNQARFFDDSWEWQHSDLRTPIFGNHAEIYKIPHPALDQTLPLLPVPSEKNLSLQKTWGGVNKKRLGLCEVFLKENDQLISLLHQNLRTVEDNRYNLEVMLSIAELCRQNLLMIKGLARIDQFLSLSASTAATRPAVSISLIDQSLDLAADILAERNRTLDELITTWYKEWRPLVPEANGRKYLQQVDDVKDHEPVRTIDMNYLVYRQLHYPLQTWTGATLKARNNFAKQHNLPIRNYQLNWTGRE
jgi:hexosaminidase